MMLLNSPVVTVGIASSGLPLHPAHPLLIGARHDHQGLHWARQDPHIKGRKDLAARMDRLIAEARTEQERARAAKRNRARDSLKKNL